MNSIFALLCKDLGLDPTVTVPTLSLRTIRILRHYQRQADLGRENPYMLLPRLKANLAGANGIAALPQRTDIRL